MHVFTETKNEECHTLNHKILLNQVKLNLYENEQSRILSEINDSAKQPKLRTYKLFKTSYCIEPYLTSNLPKKTYTNSAWFRVSSHNLKIETGQHDKPKTPIEERKCDKCNSNEIEDELHCLIICSKNITPRMELFLKASQIIPELLKLSPPNPQRMSNSCGMVGIP